MISYDTKKFLRVRLGGGFAWVAGSYVNYIIRFIIEVKIIFNTNKDNYKLNLYILIITRKLTIKYIKI